MTLASQTEGDRAHRRDIDGLRALAILPVIGFHARVWGFSGGFVGVDIFFVISGFLITSIISRELSEDGFSIGEFYKRRAIRILPSLITMLIVSSTVARYVLFPKDLLEFENSVAATALFVSNIFFMQKTSYFGASADEKPLLHMWSLSIEEQFYLFFPLIMLALWHRCRRGVLPVIVAISVFSFALCIAGAKIAPTTNFYLLIGRAWELGIGAIASLGACPMVSSKNCREAFSAIGLAMILTALSVLDTSSVFPGVSALLPCIGAVLIIVYGAGTFTSRVLASRPAVAIGLISYPLYLWHWPLLVFATMKFGISDTPVPTASVIALSVVVAVVSTIVVERRLSPYLRRLSSTWVCAGAVVAMGLIAGLGVLQARRGDGVRTYSPEVASILKYADYAGTAEHRYQNRTDTCFIASRAAAANFNRLRCMRIDPVKPDYLLIGDSYAAHYWRALSLRFPGVNILQVTATGCNPLNLKGGEPRCAVIRDVMADLLDGRGTPDKIILSAQWSVADVAELVRITKELRRRGSSVVILGPITEYRSMLPHLLARAVIEQDSGFVVRAQKKGRRRLDRVMGARMAAENIPYISIYDIICPHNQCRTMASPGVPLQFDYGHLTLEGARFVVSRFPAL